MRVTHLCEVFECGGIESMIVDLCCETQHDTDHRILQFYSRRTYSSRPELRAPLVPVHMNRSLRVEPLGWHRIRRDVAEFDPDVIHCHGYYAALCGLLLRRPVVYTVHASIHCGGHRCDPLIRTVAKRCTKVVAVSHQVAHDIAQFTGGAVNPEVILNGVAAERVAVPASFDREKKRRELGCSQEELIFVCVASLNNFKNHPALLRAFARAQSVLGRARLLLAGDGPDREPLQNLANELAPAEIVFLGERSDVAEILRAADVFVLSTHGEGMPISVIEAVLCGIPIVASRVAALVELQRSGLHLLLPEPSDVNSLADALVKISDENYRASIRVALSTQTVFSMFDTARKYRLAYDAAVESHDRRVRTCNPVVAE